MGQTMGTGNVADDDEESLVFADESEYMTEDDESPAQPCDSEWCVVHGTKRS